MTRPDTCGAAGGAISVWVKVIEPAEKGGIISSCIQGSAGSLIFNNENMIEYDE